MTSRAIKNEQAILARLGSVGQARLAEAIGVDESTIPQWKSNGRLKQIADVLAGLGLKAVPETHKCVNAEKFTHVMFLADIGANALARNAENLLFEDAE